MAECSEERKQQGPKPPGRLYVKAVFAGYKRSQRNQHEQTALLKLDGVHNKRDAQWYVGKRALYVYTAHNKTKVSVVTVFRNVFTLFF